MGEIRGEFLSVPAGAKSAGDETIIGEGVEVILSPRQAFLAYYTEGARAFEAVEDTVVRGPGTIHRLPDAWVTNYEASLTSTKLTVALAAALPAAIFIFLLYPWFRFMTMPMAIFCLIGAQLMWPKKPEKLTSGSLPATEPAPGHVIAMFEKLSSGRAKRKDNPQI